MTVPDTEGALAGVRVVDLLDERGIYGGKMLADLGADVIRVEPASGDPLRQRGPLSATGDSLWYAYYASNRRFVTLDATTDGGRTALAALCGSADVVLDAGALAAAGVDEGALLRDHPALVLVSLSSFGREGPWAEYLAPDLVAAALGGVAATTGDTDTPPLRGFGEMTFAVPGGYVAIAALAALRHARGTGEGQRVDLNVHETLVSCLEHVLMWLWYHERLPMALGPVLPRRGSLHWSDAYEVMNARDGAIMVTITPDPQRLLAWLVEEGAQQDLLDERYLSPSFAGARPMTGRFMEVLEDWVATKEVAPFFFESQARHHPFGWVLPPDHLAANPHLSERDWWVEHPLPGGGGVRGPGAPYHFSETPWTAPGAPRPVAAEGDDDPAAVLREIGWDA
ncbi:MAG: CoA transferase [Dehalococcoidia bacterium]